MTTPRRKLGLVLGAVLVALGLTAPAQAGTLVASAPSCSQQVMEQPFTRWLDYASYTLVPGGSFEKGAPSWTLSGGASVVKGNESFYVHSRKDARSLALPAGSSAVSRSVCVAATYPTLRLFARQAGSTAGTLDVDVLFEDALGNVQSAPIAALTAGSSWAPTAPIAIVANLLLLPPDNTTAVAFRFSADGGSFRIDDVYVDPYMR